MWVFRAKLANEDIVEFQGLEEGAIATVFVTTLAVNGLLLEITTW